MKKSILKIGPLSIPRITIGTGSPTILIVAGMHGDEFSQQLVIQRLLADPPQLKRGSIIILPRLNPLGLARNTEKNPIDKININRVFPGNAASPNVSQRLARKVFELALKSDAVIDLHNFTDPALPQTIYVEVGQSLIRKKSMELCRVYGFPLIWRIRANDPSMTGVKKTLIYNVAQAGVPAIGVELPPLDTISEQELRAGVNGLRRILRSVTESGKNKSRRKITIINRVNLIAPQAGIFMPGVLIGTKLRAGSVLGRIILPNRQETVIRTNQTGLLTRIRRPGPVNKKQLICNIGMKK